VDRPKLNLHDNGTRMGSTLTRRAGRYFSDAGRGFEAAPVEVATALFLAVAWSVAVEAGGEAMRSWWELAIVGVLVIAAAWTATLLHALGAWSARRRWMVTAAGAVAAALYGALVLDLERGAEGWRAAMLVGAAVLWLISMPWLRARSIDEMRAVTGRVLLRTLGALLYSVALFVGLALALRAVDTLFELSLGGEIYGHVFGWIFVALAPWIVIGGIADYVRPSTTDVASVVHRMAAFLVPPLLAIYCVILYAYAVRIGVTGEVPKNLLSPMVLAAGALGALALLLFDPRPGSTATARVLRAAPPLFVPLAALGVWAILMRVDQYGWTEFRLLRLILLVVLGGLAVAATIQFARHRRFSLHVATLGFAGVLLLSAVGPWNVSAVSRRDQQARLAEALRAADIDAAAAAPSGAERTVPATVYDAIASITNYLASHHGVGALPPALAGHLNEPHDAYEAVRRLGIRPAPVVDDTVQEMRYGRLSHVGAIDVGGVSVRRVYAAPYRGETRSGDATAVQDGELLRIRVDGERLTARLGDIIASLESPRRPGGNELTPERARHDVVDDAGTVRGSLLVLEINAEVGGGVPRLHRLDALLVLERR
jgi:hypothetical protein